MKKLAARDFKDLLQVGLREILRPLLTFVCCSARFQSSRGFSLHLMTRWSSTSFFPWRPGILMPNYGSIPNQHLARWRLKRLHLVRLSAGLLEPAAFNTRELPREEAARGRRKAAAAAKKGKGKAAQGTKDGPRSHPFNLRTYKLHALGDYVKTIRLFGTTDNYSTQVV